MLQPPPFYGRYIFCVDYIYTTRIFCQSINLSHFSTTKNHNQERPKSRSSALFITIKHYLSHSIIIDHYYPSITSSLSIYYASFTSASSDAPHSSRTVPWGFKKLDCIIQSPHSPICATLLHDSSPTPSDFGSSSHQYYRQLR